jgi:hypothetical protein
MNDRRWLVPFLNLGHLLDHLAMLVFPTAVLALGAAWDRPYSELLPLALGGFIAFGAFAIPAGWLADHWRRYRVLAIFFFGIGAALFVTGFSRAEASQARPSPLPLDQRQRLALQHAQHSAQLMTALQEQTCRGDDAVNALAARQLGIFLDAVKRRLGGAAEDREHRPVAQHVDGIIAPFALGDALAVE